MQTRTDSGMMAKNSTTTGMWLRTERYRFRKKKMDAQDRPPFQYRSTSIGMVNTKSYHKIPVEI